jgi:hypothetical protein
MVCELREGKGSKKLAERETKKRIGKVEKIGTVNNSCPPPQERVAFASLFLPFRRRAQKRAEGLRSGKQLPAPGSEKRRGSGWAVETEKWGGA